MMLPRPLALSVLLAGLLAAGCAERASEPPTPLPAAARPALDSVATGATMYVPVYSHIYHGNRRRVVNLAATLSVRNTDRAHPIELVSVRYYDSTGQLVQDYAEAPRVLAPLASFDLVVQQDDTRGGSGASFLVVWHAATAVSEPVVEAVMISATASQGISFVSPGRRVGPEAAPDTTAPGTTVPDTAAAAPTGQ